MQQPRCQPAPCPTPAPAPGAQPTGLAGCGASMTARPLHPTPWRPSPRHRLLRYVLHGVIAQTLPTYCCSTAYLVAAVPRGPAVAPVLPQRAGLLRPPLPVRRGRQRVLATPAARPTGGACVRNSTTACTYHACAQRVERFWKVATGSCSAAQREKTGWVGGDEGDGGACVMQGVWQVVKLHEALSKHLVRSVLLAGRQR